MREFPDPFDYIIGFHIHQPQDIRKGAHSPINV